MTAIDTYVARVAATAPALTAAQRERLTGLLRPSLSAHDPRKAVCLR